MFSIFKAIKPFFRKKKLQVKWGFPPEEIWNLNETIAEYVLPRLKIFAEHSPSQIYYDENGESIIGHPGEKKRKVSQCFEDMIFAFESCTAKNAMTISSPEEREKIKRGFRIFAENFQGLWW